jgi:hypothetical protein
VTTKKENISDTITIDSPSLPPSVDFYLPPALIAIAKQIADQEPLVHPIWRKFKKKGRGYFVAKTNDLKDIEEIADWAHSWLIEPEAPLNKPMRQAFKNVIERTNRYVYFHRIGSFHVIAEGWKPSKKKEIL